MPHHARCLCGQIDVTIDAEPIAARMCWCRLCQYLGAGSGTVNVAFPTDSLTATGEVSWYASVADSGAPMRRGFCPRCGTPVFSLAETRPHVTLIRAGALDDPSLLAPQSVIWTEAAPDWATHDPDLPHFPGQTPPIS